MRKFKYGWKPDLPDHRDFKYSVSKPLPLPPIVDLRAGCSPVEDQGTLGSCTAHALTAALEFLEKKDGLEVSQMSRLFVYYNERAMEGTIESDDGAQIRDGIKTLVESGCCHEEKWPYKIEDFTKKPADECFKEGLNHQVTLYKRLMNVNDMKQCLAAGYPFVFGFSVYESFESKKVADTGIAELPSKKEESQGGHAVMCVGYDEAKKRFLIRNSWGPDWGMHGYFTLPYAYLEARDLSDDFWAVYKGEDI